MCCSQGDLLTVTAKIQLKTETTKLNTPLLRALVRADFRTVSRAPVTGSNKDISWTQLLLNTVCFFIQACYQYCD